MKNTILKWYMFTSLFLVSFFAFAQVGDDEGTGDPLETTGDTDPTPINAKMIYLVILAVVFAYFYYRNSQKKVNA